MLCLAATGRAASAQTGGSVAVASEDSFRGHALSRGRPVASVDLSYDHSTGLYLGGSATVVATARDVVEPLTSQLNIGYARRVNGGATLDTGLVRADYSRFTNGDRPAHYHEAYLGVIAGSIASHLYYSPDYLRPGLRSLYADLDIARRVGARWRLSGHGGVLAQFTRPLGRPVQYDWRAGAVRELGWADLRVALASGGPGPDFVAGRPRRRTTLVVGISHAF